MEIKMTIYENNQISGDSSNIQYGIFLDEGASELTRGPGGLFTETNMWQSQR